jgi:hypothetical protein
LFFPACYKADSFIFSCCAAWLSSAGCYNMMQIQSLLTLRGFCETVAIIAKMTLRGFCQMRSVVFFLLNSKQAQTSLGIFDELST